MDRVELPVEAQEETRSEPRIRSRWLNAKLILGLSLVLFVVLIGLVGPLLWNLKLADVTSSPISLPPSWVAGGQPGHPLGTDQSGRDVLATIIVGAPRSLAVGIIAASIGLLIGLLLGSISGFFGGWTDNIIRTFSDSIYTIPPLAVLIVIASYVRVIGLSEMALVLALFAWPGPTRFIRAQVLTLRERGYVRMAKLSGVRAPGIMLREMAPNILPWLASALTGNVSGSILAAASLEALGLGPTRTPSLGTIVYYAISANAILQGMWWWWGFPIVTLMLIFIGLFLITIGLDEIANPRLRKAT